MNRRDVTAIARSLHNAHSKAFYAQTAATSWAFCIEALADALAEINPSFDRAEFMGICRGGGAQSVEHHEDAPSPTQPKDGSGQ